MGRRTPLYEAHRRLGGRMVDFAGWDLPVCYTSAIDEHRAVRERCGLFDVSHMGELELRGETAGRLAQILTTNDVARLPDGGAHYTLACAETGGVIDDLILYRRGPEHYLAVVNAAHTSVMRAWAEQVAGRVADARVVDVSADWALLAVQGPRALEAIGAVAGRAFDTLRPFTVTEGRVAGTTVVISRTGYTGEEGVEVFVPAADARPVWDRVLEAVRDVGGCPAGLAARDTLRLEAALPLCGTDMDEGTTPLEAGLGWAVRFVADNDFIGRPALEAQARAQGGRHLVCFVMEAPGVPRTGYELRRDGVVVGRVTSGAKSPTLGSFIGMGYVGSGDAAVGTGLEVLIRGRALPARVVARPFYRRAMRAGRSNGDPQGPVVHA